MKVETYVTKDVGEYSEPILSQCCRGFIIIKYKNVFVIASTKCEVCDQKIDMYFGRKTSTKSVRLYDICG